MKHRRDRARAGTRDTADRKVLETRTGYPKGERRASQGSATVEVPGYIARLVLAQLIRPFQSGSYTSVHVVHDDTCPVLQGVAECKCLPGISFVDRGCRVTVDELGIPHEVRLS